jgi:DNA-binding beta-propeller fold protein YncE
MRRLLICACLLSSARLWAGANAFQITAGSTVSVFNTNSMQETGAIGFPYGRGNVFMLSPDGSHAFICCDLIEVDTATRLTTRQFTGLNVISLGAMALSPDGKTIYASTVESYLPLIAIFDIASDQIVGTITDSYADSAVGPGSLHISADGRTLYSMHTRGAGSPRGGVLSIIDVASRTVKSHVEGPFYGPYAITPDGRHLYATIKRINSEPSGLLEFDVQTGSLLASFPVAPYALAISSDGATLYAAGSGLIVIDTATGKVNYRFGLPPVEDQQFSYLGVSPVEDTVYYAYQDRASLISYVAVISVSGLSVKNVKLATQPTGISVSPNGTALYVNLYGPTLVTALDYHTGRQAGSIEVPGATQSDSRYPSAVVLSGGQRVVIAFNTPGPLPAPSGGFAIADTTTFLITNSVTLDGRTPSSSLALTADGRTMYAGTMPEVGANYDIEAFDVSSLALIKTIPTTGVIQSPAISPDGRFLYALESYNSAVKIDLDSGQVVGSIAFGLAANQRADSLILSPGGDTLYAGIGCCGTRSPPRIKVIATDTFKVTDTLPYCGDGLALSPDGTTLYSVECNDAGTTTIDVIDVATGSLTSTIALPVESVEPVVTPDGGQLWAPGFVNANPCCVTGISTYNLATQQSALLPTWSNLPVVFSPMR